MKFFFTLIVTALLVVPSVLASEKPDPDPALSAAEIQEAIAIGQQKDPKDIGLHLGVSRFSLGEIAAGFTSDRGLFDGRGASQLGVSVQTPETWIQLGSSLASQNGFLSQTLTVTDVAGDMVKPVLRVLLKPVRVNRAVIASTNEKHVIQPVAIAPCPQAMPFGDEMESCTEFRFSLEDIEQIRSEDSKGEFYIVAMATTSGAFGERVIADKKFKVKTKHFGDLGWTD